MITIEEHITIKDQCEIMAHIDRKAKSFGNTATTDEIYADIFSMAMRESGAYSLNFANPKYLYAMHDAIDSYELPNYLAEKMVERKTNDGC